ncbi:Hypothetical_protein [Hexamita inflata]|uniref:Hypothetical_protein n=1 Tax=Hexamita inflata TaxID=28002 RepID=A0AA86RHZ6_9EUKA|nr:Hypothetical protein HINF_LOCUS60099 [Hexamita inflata]
MCSIVGSHLSSKLTILSQFGIYSFLSYENNFEIMNKSTTQWIDLTRFLAQSIVSSKNNFMVYFCNKIPLVFQNNQIKTIAGQILLNDVQNMQYNNLTSELNDTQSQCIIQQNNEHFNLLLNNDEQYQIMVELTNIDNVTQPECKTFSSCIEWEEFLNKCVEDHVTSIQNSENIRDEYWIIYTEVMHPGVYVSQPAELTFILEEISKNQFKNIDNAVKYLKTISDSLIQLQNLICFHISVFNFIFSYLYEVIIEIFKISNTNIPQIIKLLFLTNYIDEAIELVSQSQSLYAQEEFLNYLNSTQNNCKLSLAKYQLFVSNFYLLFQDNLPNLDFQNIFTTMFVYHLMLYGTEQINISFDPNIKLYIGKHTNNIVQILDYATQLQVVILSQSYNKYVDYFISQQNEMSQLGLTCFQIAIMGGNTEMIVKFKDQIQIQTYHITSLMLLMTTYQESIPDTILERLIELQAGMISKNKLCAFQLYLQEPKPIPKKYIKILLEKEFKLLAFDSIKEFMAFLSLRQFRYLNLLSFIDGVSVSDAVLYTIIQHGKTYQAFKFINPDMKRNTRFHISCANITNITHEQIKLLFQHFSFSLSNDWLFLAMMLQQQTNLKPIQSCLKNSFNELRGFSCYDFAINFMKIQQEKDFKKVDYFFKPIIAGEFFDRTDIFQRNEQDHQLLLKLMNDLWQSD